MCHEGNHLSCLEGAEVGEEGAPGEGKAGFTTATYRSKKVIRDGIHTKIQLLGIIFVI